MDALVGQTMDVLIDGPSDEHEWVITGRLETQAPDVDGSVCMTRHRTMSDLDNSGRCGPRFGLRFGGHGRCLRGDHDEQEPFRAGALGRMWR